MKRVVLRTLIVLLLPVSLPGQHLRAVTEQFPPYSYEHDGRVGGISVEIVSEIARVARLSVEIEVLPWSRAYRQARRGENVLLFSIGRTPQRERELQWIGPIVPYPVSFFSYGDSVPVIQGYSDLVQYTVGVVDGDMRDQILSRLEGLRIIRYRDSNRMLRALSVGAVDLAPVPDLNLPYFAEHLGLDASRFRQVYTMPELSSTGLYLATGLQTPAQIVERLRDALTIVQDSGFIEQTRQRYLDR